MNAKWSYLVMYCLVVLCHPVCVIQGQDRKKVNRVQKLSESIDLQIRAAHSGYYADFLGSANVGVLESGKTYKIRLNVENATSRDIEFDRITGSCQCGQFEIGKPKIPAGETVVGTMTWEVPASSQQAFTVATATFYNKGEPVGEIRLKAHLKGNFYVGLQGIGRRADGDFFEWRLPIMVSQPIQLKNLEFELSDELKGYMVRLVESNPNSSGGDPIGLPTNDTESSRSIPKSEKGWLLIVAHEKFVGNEFRFGQLVVRDPVSRKRKRHDLALYIKPPVRISPVQIRFRSVKNENSKLEAFVLVQFDEIVMPSESIDTNGNEAPSSLSMDSERTEEHGQLIAKLFLNERPLKLDVTPIGKRVYRIGIRANRDDLKTRDQLSGEWVVTIGGKTFEVPTSAIVD